MPRTSHGRELGTLCPAVADQSSVCSEGSVAGWAGIGGLLGQKSGRWPLTCGAHTFSGPLHSDSGRGGLTQCFPGVRFNAKALQ